MLKYHVHGQICRRKAGLLSHLHAIQKSSLEKWTSSDKGKQSLCVCVCVRERERERERVYIVNKFRLVIMQTQKYRRPNEKQNSLVMVCSSNTLTFILHNICILTFSLYIYIYIYCLWLCVSIYIYIYEVCISVYNIYKYTLYDCVYIYIYVCVCVCVYNLCMSRYMYTSMHTCMCVYIDKTHAHKYKSRNYMHRSVFENDLFFLVRICFIALKIVRS